MTKRVTDLDDPKRCKAGTRAGQCVSIALEGSDFCILHSGVDRAPARNLRQYILLRAQDQERLAQAEDPDGLKTLRDEVLIATGMLERRLNLAVSDPEFLTAFPQIERFLKTLADLKKSSLFLEEKSGVILSRSVAFRWVQEIINIVSDELEGNPDRDGIVDRIVDRILPSVRNAHKLDATVNEATLV